MGAKTWMLVLSDNDARSAFAAKAPLNKLETDRQVRALFPGEVLELIGEGSLSYTCPPDNEIHAACYPGVTLIAAKEFGIDYPSRLAQRFSSAGSIATLHAMHSAVDWFAYAVWKDGVLLRSLSLSPDSGILEDIGQRMAFEEPYWSGGHSAVDDEEDGAYPFPFHPLELGEAALNDLFGYQLEGVLDAALLDPDSIPLLCYRRSRSAWWKFW
ncbi:MAG TPA: hypothetical protein VF050_03315 [Moraxellaceae bacterium]